jgi:hypothetical protein
MYYVQQIPTDAYGQQIISYGEGFQQQQQQQDVVYQSKDVFAVSLKEDVCSFLNKH